MGSRVVAPGDTTASLRGLMGSKQQTAMGTGLLGDKGMGWKGQPIFRQTQVFDATYDATYVVKKVWEAFLKNG